MLQSLLLSLFVAAGLCLLASRIFEEKTPRNIAYVVIVLACLGGFIGFGGIVKAASLPQEHCALTSEALDATIAAAAASSSYF